MKILSERIAQADDPIYKSGLTISLHRDSSESTHDTTKSRKNTKEGEQENPLGAQKEVSTKDNHS